MANGRPHSTDYFGAPWGTREASYRATPSTPFYVQPNLRGVVAGTPAYDAGAPRAAPKPHEVPKKTAPLDVSYLAPASTVDFSELPYPYDWDGTGVVPDELWAFLSDLSSAGFPSLPAQSDSHALGVWLGNLYTALTTPGEGCGVDPRALKMAIVNNAALGPHQTAYAVQQAVLTSDYCAQFIKNPLTPPAVTRNAPPTPTGVIDIGTPNKPPGLQVRKPVPWGWVIGGIGVLAAVGLGVYFTYRGAKKRKRKNPCACANPVVVEAVGYEAEDLEENPYAGDLGFTSIDGGVLQRAAKVSPVLNNPRRRRRKK
ncbi:MAG: hypothetical protein ACRENK_16350 [Gemmatimonadaceae bacterium]